MVEALIPREFLWCKQKLADHFYLPRKLGNSLFFGVINERFLVLVGSSGTVRSWKKECVDQVLFCEGIPNQCLILLTFHFVFVQ